MSLRILGVLLIVLGLWLLLRNGWAWWNGYLPVLFGLGMALYVRRIEFDDRAKTVTTTTGFFPFAKSKVHPHSELRALKLTVNHRGGVDSPLKPTAIYRSSLVFDNGRWARLMSGRNIKWIEKRTQALSSAIGVEVDMTESYKRYREQFLAKQ